MVDKVEPVIETSVDELLKILKTRDKMPIPEVAKMLHVSLDVVQSWIDFLVEEKILGIEYKFTVPYVFLNPTEKEEISPAPAPQQNKSLQDFKVEFNERAESSLPQGKGRMLVVNLWKQHLQVELDRKKHLFLSEAAKRNLPEPDKLWAEYVQKAISV